MVGTSGSGKSSLARRISRQLGIPHIELDAIHHRADWTPLPTEQFRAEVSERIAPERWVADGAYHSKLGFLVWDRADTVVWFDLPKAQVMFQIVRRSVSRAFTREELWNGNRENWRNLFALRPAQSVIMWAWTTYDRNRTRYLAAQNDPAFAHRTFVRVRSHRAADRFLADLTPH
ncbi:hypothetical protein [Nocardia sp. NPDC004415]